FVVGAILTFALNVQTDWIDLDLVGYLLMGAGIVVTIIGIALLVRRRQSITTVRSDVDPATGTRVDQRATETDPLPRGQPGSRAARVFRVDTCRLFRARSPEGRDGAA